MELTIRTNKVTAGSLGHRFATLGGQLVGRDAGVVRAARGAEKAPDAVAVRRRLEQAAFGVIGLGGRGLFS
jgi:hypothetical protein